MEWLAKTRLFVYLSTKCSLSKSCQPSNKSLVHSHLRSRLQIVSLSKVWSNRPLAESMLISESLICTKNSINRSSQTRVALLREEIQLRVAITLKNTHLTNQLKKRICWGRSHKWLLIRHPCKSLRRRPKRLLKCLWVLIQSEDLAKRKSKWNLKFKSLKIL